MVKAQQIWTFAVMASLCCCAGLIAGEPAVSHVLGLEGPWRLALDPRRVGVTENWFASDLPAAETIKLPGSLQEQGYGSKPSAKTGWVVDLGAKSANDARFAPYVGSGDGEFKVPGWLTPRRHYVGSAWYQRKVTLPPDWSGQRVILHLERPHWQTEVWVNGKRVGSQDGLAAPHEYDLTEWLIPGEQRITIRIHNGMVVPVGADSHGVTDHTQTAWNGVIGRIFLERRAPGFSFEDVQVYPDVKQRSVKVVARYASTNPSALAGGTLQVQAEAFNGPTGAPPPPISIPLKGLNKEGLLEFEYPLGESAHLWDEFSPVLYRLTLETKGVVEVRREVVFGLREIGTKGTQFTINGRPIFLRGTNDGCIFPKTGYPPTDVESWKRILRICQEHGLNHVRFHSWCPPEAAFQAADELGMYFQVEASVWATFGKGTAVDEWIGKESQRMLKAFGNHPSFILMALGNEPHPAPQRDALLGTLTKDLATADPRRLFCAGTHRTVLPENQFHVTGAPRMERYPATMLSNRPQTMADYREFMARNTVPHIAHETVQYCAYPNFEEIAKYDGFLKAGNYEIARDMLAKAGLGSHAKDFLMASGRFQTLLHKAEIEASLRTPNFSGFQMLSLQDYPGQGTSPVGILDAFWEPKGYVTPEEYRRFCGPTVPLARMKKLVFTSNEGFEAGLEVAHYGPNAMDVEPFWRLRDADGKTLLSGELPKAHVPTGELTVLGRVGFPLSQFQKARKLTFDLGFKGTEIVNSWDIWVYPATGLAGESPSSSVHVTRDFDEKAKAILAAGGSVLLIPKPERLKAQTYGSFAPIFWNRLLFRSQKCHTVGILCDPAHPAFKSFPTGSHTDWQWWELLSGDAKSPERSKPIVLNDLGVPIEPLVRAIDDWFVGRSLGLLFEAHVGRGKLMVCSMDIVDQLESRPVARQLRRSLLDYMESADFKPAQAVRGEAIASLFRAPNLVEQFQAKVLHVSSQEKGYEGAKAIDGYPGTHWQSPAKLKPPQEIQIELNESALIAGFTYLPAEESPNWIYDPPRGRISGYEFYVSEDPSNWGEPAAKGSFQDSAAVQSVPLPKPTKGRCIRLVAIGSYDKDSQIAIGELGLIIQGGNL